MKLADELALRYDRVVFWGHLNTQADFHYIFGPWRATLMRCGYESLWVDDATENAYCVRPRSLVIAMDTTAKYMPIVDGVDYVLHNFCPEQIDRQNKVNIQVYTDQVVASCPHERWGRFTFFDRGSQQLVQPWGSDLMAHEFHDPVFPENSLVVNWVGSVWNNELDQGNAATIELLEKELRARGLEWRVLRHVSDEANVEAVRQSRIAPAIAGRWQREVGYLPCRFFKNVAYGQLGLTNVHRFTSLCTLFESSAEDEATQLADLVDWALGLDRQRWTRLVIEQQDAIAGLDYAYKTRCLLRAFDEVR